MRFLSNRLSTYLMSRKKTYYVVQMGLLAYTAILVFVAYYLWIAWDVSSWVLGAIDVLIFLLLPSWRDLTMSHEKYKASFLKR
jgi:hypothetical protein